MMDKRLLRDDAVCTTIYKYDMWQVQTQPLLARAFGPGSLDSGPLVPIAVAFRHMLRSEA